MSKEEKTELKAPTYPSINSVKIDESVLNTIIKLKNKPKSEGILFGRETEDSIEVTTAIPFSISDPNIVNLTSYLEVNRLDYMKLGFFFCNDQSSMITKANMKIFIEFQKVFPNAIIICLDVNLLNVNCYPFKCFRLHKHLMELVDIAEIEEDIVHLQEKGQEESQQSVFKKFIQTNEILINLNLRIIEDKTNLFKILAVKEEKIESKKPETSLNSTFDFSMNRKITQLNKNCEKFIDEQKKYINYYKVKKTYGKKKESEFIEMILKKGNELSNLDKSQISIESKNILNMNQQLKAMIDQNEINNYLNLKLIN